MVQWKKFLVAMMAPMVVAVTLTSCTKPPSAPSESPDAESTATANSAGAGQGTNPVTTPTAPAESCENERSINVVEVLAFSAQEGTMSVKNTGTCSHWVGLALYRILGGGNGQELVKGDFRYLAPNATAKFSLSTSGLCNWQLDGAVDMEEALPVGPDGIPRYGNKLLNVDKFGGNYGSRPCTGPTPPPTPPPPPSCGSLNIVLSGASSPISETSTNITYHLTANVSGTFNPGQPVTYEKLATARTEDILFTSDAASGVAGCKKSAKVNVPAKPVNPPSCPELALSFSADANNVSDSAALVNVTSNWNGSAAGTVSWESVGGSGATSAVKGTKDIGTFPRQDASYPVNLTLTVAGCKKSAKVTIQKKPAPPQRTCNDVRPQLSVVTNGNKATCTGSWNNPGSGMMALDNQAGQPISNGGSKTYSNLSPGSHSCELTVEDGNLTCRKEKSFSIACAPTQHNGQQLPTNGNWNPYNAACSWYGLKEFDRDEQCTGNSTHSQHTAPVVIVKAGSAQSCSNPNRSYFDVHRGDVISAPCNKEISHVIYCKCPD